MIRFILDFLGTLLFFFFQGLIKIAKGIIVFTIIAGIVIGIGYTIFYFGLLNIIVYTILSIIFIFLIALLGAESWYKQ